MPTNKQLRRIPKSAFNLNSATANRRKCLKKSKSLRQIAKGANLFLSTTANRKIGLVYFFRLRTANCKKGPYFSFSPTANCKKGSPTFFFAVDKKAATKKITCGENCCAPKTACCAARNQPRGCFREKTDILAQLLRPRNSATAN